MKIPSGGDDFRIPPQPPSVPGSPGGPGTPASGPDAARKADFDKKLESAEAGKTSGPSGPSGPSSPASAAKADGPQTAKLRELVGDLDPNAPDAQEKVADALVVWTLTERFGDGILIKFGVDGLRRSVQQQMLADPTMEQRIKQILAKL